ncbi:hypothetical protein [Streptomyces sp. NPDC056982]|uniref:hypothetical protein n=1 Tax=Streptomyces sp. NPDC056982 TaxID=3345986 RepID=UPI0036293E31
MTATSSTPCSPSIVVACSGLAWTSGRARADAPSAPARDHVRHSRGNPPGAARCTGRGLDGHAGLARSLAFRLACLQRPDDPELLREATADLLSFGPDWDDFAEDLKARATRLDG